MHPFLLSKLIADRQADLMASARQHRLARQARAARRARPDQRRHAAPLWRALGRLVRRRPSLLRPRKLARTPRGSGV